MKERLNHELISKDLYKFSQNSEAKYHLVIDRKFCNALYYDKIRINKHFNVQYLEIKYVFKDSQYQKFENKYYSTIAKIMSKSPLLHTLKYELTHNKLQGKLDVKQPDRYCGKSGHLLAWMDNIRHNKNATMDIFESITKLIWNQTQWMIEGSWHPPSEWRKKYNLFFEYLPNLASFICIKPRSYVDRTDYDDTDCIWMIFKKPNYYQNLECIQIDMASSLSEHRWNSGHINLNNHPLSHFYKFKKLKSLKLKLPLFQNCHQYYWSYLQNDMFSAIGYDAQCINLINVSIEFELTSDDYVSLRDVAVADCEWNRNQIINGLCRYILVRCPNIKKYTLITNNIANDKHKLNHLIPFYDKLESLETDTPNIFHDDLRMISLKRLKLRINANSKKELKTEYKSLKGFRNLELFHCVYVIQKPFYRKNRLNKYPFLITKIKRFIEFVWKQNENKHLKHVGIYHEISEDIKTRMKRVDTAHKKSKFFNLNDCTKQSSLDLCRSIISLLTLNDGNHNIESIEINPIALKTSELEYLYFWYCNEYGTFNTHNEEMKSKVILTDLYCANSTS